MPNIHLETFIRAPIERAFDLMRDVDAHLQSAPASNERVVAGRTSGLFEAGDEVTWEAKHMRRLLEDRAHVLKTLAEGVTGSGSS